MVVMGRKTLETFPNGLPLMGRTNIVLTHDKKFRVPGALIVHDMEELHEELEKYNSEDIYVIGGESVYRQLIDECDVAHVTKIDFAYDADAHFPDLDADPAWEITAASTRNFLKNLLFFIFGFLRIPGVIPLRQGDLTACIGFQESRQLSTVHLDCLNHADNLQVFFLGDLLLQVTNLFLQFADLGFRLFNLTSVFLNRRHKISSFLKFVTSSSDRSRGYTGC